MAKVLFRKIMAFFFCDLVIPTLQQDTTGTLYRILQSQLYLPPRITYALMT
jgi:hypothetical protein